MNIVETDDFRKRFAKTPKEIRNLYEQQKEIFIARCTNPRLHVKKIKMLPNAFSIRITRRYRAFFFFHQQDVAIFFAIDHRKDAYR